MSQKDMGIRMAGFLEQKRAPDSKIVFKNWDERFRKWQIEDIFSYGLDSNFELLTSKGKTPFPLGVFMEVIAKSHFTHVALTVWNIDPEPEHEREPSIYG